ncbi:hypothetical protein TSAR_000148, partial [Trichomalopsis sarcophagae]
EQIREAFATLFNRTDKRILQNLKTWLNSVKLENFSIFGLLVSTNNAIEASHSQLRHKIGKHPQVWHFVLWKKYLITRSIRYDGVVKRALMRNNQTKFIIILIHPDFDERVLHMLTQAGALALPRDNLENPNHAVIDILIDPLLMLMKKYYQYELEKNVDVENVENQFNGNTQDNNNEDILYFFIKKSFEGSKQ